MRRQQIFFQLIHKHMYSWKKKIMYIVIIIIIERAYTDVDGMRFKIRKNKKEGFSRRRARVRLISINKSLWVLLTRLMYI